MLTCKGTRGGERLAGVVRFNVPAVTSSGFGVAGPAPLHPFGPVGRHTPMQENEGK